MVNETDIFFKALKWDGMGQCLAYHQDGRPMFISGVLPGEEGHARVTQSKKKFIKAYLVSLDKLEKVSPLRAKSPCEHYQECGGCQFLHTPYSQEVQAKTDALIHQASFSFPNLPFLQIHTFQTRQLGGRNRLQLHYNSSAIGAIGRNGQVVPIPHCQQAVPEIASALPSLKAKKGKGICELYKQDSELKLSWNKGRSVGGFSQVIEDQNKLFKDYLKDLLKKLGPQGRISFDLFGGKGNLTKDNELGETAVIDATPHKYAAPYMDTHQNYYELELYDKNALEEFKKRTSLRPSLFFIDPPRSGFRGIENWTNEYRPDLIFYLSCKASTAIRDIKEITDHYEIYEWCFFDFFPGTAHFETFFALRRK